MQCGRLIVMMIMMMMMMAKMMFIMMFSLDKSVPVQKNLSRQTVTCCILTLLNMLV